MYSAYTSPAPPEHVQYLFLVGESDKIQNSGTPQEECMYEGISFQCTYIHTHMYISSTYYLCVYVCWSFYFGYRYKCIIITRKVYNERKAKHVRSMYTRLHIKNDNKTATTTTRTESDHQQTQKHNVVLLLFLFICTFYVCLHGEFQLAHKKQQQ